MTDATLYIWLKGATSPVPAAEIRHDAPARVCKWTFREDYLARKEAFTPDPLHLPLNSRTHQTRAQDGLFGVLTDAAPGHFGLRMWRERLGYDAPRIELLLRVPALGSGALLLGEPTPDRLQPPPQLEDLQRQAADILGGDVSTLDNADFISALRLSPTTGGAKPKIDLLDESGWPCIAKFADVGDPPSLPRIEAAAMMLAHECDIEVETPRIVPFEGAHGRREALLQRRFDRRLAAGGIQHLPYASAFTVLDLSTGNEPHASYSAFAHELRRWCARGSERDHAVQQQRELWRRIVFNGLIGNTDDHPRNHAVIRDDGRWKLSPVFDVLPYSRAPGQHCALRMAYDRDGRLQAVTPEGLLAAAGHYGWRHEEAAAELRRMATIISARHEAELRAWNVPQSEIRSRASAFGIAREVVGMKTV